jgi:REP element-mobilizing transposase RayT
MSRLRRLVVSDRWFFITCRLLPRRRILSPLEFTTLAKVIDERRAEHGFFLTAWVFLPDDWHASFYPRHPVGRRPGWRIAQRYGSRLQLRFTFENRARILWV